MEDSTVADPRVAVNDLVKLWDERPKDQVSFDTSRVSSLGHFLEVYAFAHHVRILAEPARDLLVSGNSIAALPNVRAAYETAVTAQWASLTRHSPEMLNHRYDQSVAAFRRDMLSAATPVLREAAADSSAEQVQNLNDSAFQAARNFEKMCGDLMPEGTDLYLYYRQMSLEVHPGAFLIDRYLHADETDPSRVSLRSQPEQKGLVEWMGMLAVSLLWALSALDHLELGQPHAAELDEIASRIPVTRMLALTPAAAPRYFEEDRALRRAHWRGPKPKRHQGSPTGD